MFYYRILRPHSSTQFRLVISKSLLLVVAVLAAMVAAQKPGTILSMVAWAFSIAGSAFFPALVLGIFWRRATRAGALAGMIVGLSVAAYYIFRVEVGSLTVAGTRQPAHAAMVPDQFNRGRRLRCRRRVRDHHRRQPVHQGAGQGGRAFPGCHPTRIAGKGWSMTDDRYWLRTRRLTFGLIFIWAVVTFVLTWFAAELNGFSVFGFPLGFYMAAQGLAVHLSGPDLVLQPADAQDRRRIRHRRGLAGANVGNRKVGVSVLGNNGLDLGL